MGEVSRLGAWVAEVLCLQLLPIILPIMTSLFQGQIQECLLFLCLHKARKTDIKESWWGRAGGGGKSQELYMWYNRDINLA